MALKWKQPQGRLWTAAGSQAAGSPVPGSQIYPDPELEVQVLGLPIRCIHSEEGCRWSGPLRHLQVRC